jgi:DNA-directed RNA polymerase sigma subunit (sigma70/sigma32)
MTNLSDQTRKMLDSLTPREMEVLRRRFPGVLDAYDLQEEPTKEDDQNVEK